MNIVTIVDDENTTNGTRNERNEQVASQTTTMKWKLRKNNVNMNILLYYYIAIFPFFYAILLVIIIITACLLSATAMNYQRKRKVHLSRQNIKLLARYG